MWLGFAIASLGSPSLQPTSPMIPALGFAVAKPCHPTSFRPT